MYWIHWRQWRRWRDVQFLPSFLPSGQRELKTLCRDLHICFLKSRLRRRPRRPRVCTAGYAKSSTHPFPSFLPSFLPSFGWSQISASTSPKKASLVRVRRFKFQPFSACALATSLPPSLARSLAHPFLRHAAALAAAIYSFDPSAFLKMVAVLATYGVSNYTPLGKGILIFDVNGD